MSPLDSAAPGMPVFDASAPPAPVREAARCRGLRARLLRAGREAVDDRDLLELLLSGRHAGGDAAALAAHLLEVFGTAPAVLAASPGRLRTVPGLSDDAIAAVKAAEALAIRMARAQVPQPVRPHLDSYRKVVEYCRTLADHRDVEELHLLFLDRKNRLIADELHQRGTVGRIPACPREICVRCLEVRASALILVHDHPSGDPQPSRADIDMTCRVRDALKTIEVELHDHLVVAPGDAVSFRERGLL